ncbi:MAG: lysine--tRNA ligase [Candidatus Euphemobacter frigidus]|nr:lysine--tRNA ligase [Candidatus Euphemobacter frigidus]MDP8275812.1 lysine--tRNA ligase [Candidatus Euphemobacter frigidus]
MDELKEQRLKKLKELTEQGVNPYGGRFDRRDSAAACREEYREEKKVSVAGRLTAIRGHGKTVFADLRDSSGKIQLYLRRDTLGEDNFANLKLLDLGDIVGVRGSLFTTRKGEISVMVREIILLSKALQPLPEKWHGLKDQEIRYRRRYLDLIVNEEVKELFRKRSRIIREIRLFLEERGFLEVETPMMQPLPGGAAARPFQTFYTALNTKMYLRIAPELYLKRLLVGGFEKVFELNRSFRNEGLSRKHNPEFTMLEIYEAYGDCRTMMELVESMIIHLAEQVCGTLQLNQGDTVVNLERPWKRIRYRDLINGYLKTTDWFSNSTAEMAEVAGRLDLEVSPAMSAVEITHEIYEKCVEPGLIQPTFVLELPAELVPLARRSEGDPGVVDVFELVINGFELAPGYSELNDPIEQRRRFQEQESRPPPAGTEERGGEKIDEDFLTALETGMPPAGGTGIGIDRLVMILTGANSIRDVILFPQLRPKTDT